MKKLTQKEIEKRWREIQERGAKARAQIQEENQERRKTGGQPTAEITPEVEDRLRRLYAGRPMD